ncbi:MAG: hypothetical protein ABR611_06115 [Chthoniobacterales bacterium]
MLKQLDTLIGFAVVMLVVSLLITIITQMVSSLLGLRGKNLADALEVMMFKIAPKIPNDQVKKLVQEVLTHPVISDSAMSMERRWGDRLWILKWLRQKWKMASAIRPDELYEILKAVKTDPPAAPANGAAADSAVETWQQAAGAIIKQLDATAPAGTKAAITAVTNQIETIVGDDISHAKELIQRYATATDAAFVNLEKWFNSAQDRAQQWFTLHTRWITIGAAFMAAFVLQLDTIDLLKRISTDSDLRTKLVAASGTIQEQAGKVLKDDQRTVIDQTMHKAVIDKLSGSYKSLPDLTHTGDFATMDAAKTWLSEKLASNNEKDAIVAEYERLVNAAKLDAYLDTMQKLVGATGINLLPSPYPHISKGEWSWPKRRLLGILLSAALLSLGAPFWYNALKSLTNLRPTLASAIEKNPKQSGPPPNK